MYNLTKKASLDRSAKKRASEQLNAGQNRELVEQELDKMGVTDPLARARMRMRMFSDGSGKIARIPKGMLGGAPVR